MTGSSMEPKRVVRTYRQTIDAPPDVVFPLVCPVREAEWLDGFEYTMVYSASGVAEPGAVFTTSSEGEDDTVWVISRHEPATGVVQFTRFTPGSRTCLLTIVVSACGETRSHVDISYAYTSLTPAGRAFLEGWTEDAFQGALRFWEKSMNHFLKAGTTLRKTATA